MITMEWRMKVRWSFLLGSIALCVALVACKKKEETPKPTKRRKASSQPSSRPVARQPTKREAPKLAKAPDAWIKARATAAKKRLEGSEAGKLIWKAIEAHGGLETWYAQGPIRFRFSYRPLKGKKRDSTQTVDTWSSRAKHTLTEDKDVHFGWDGKQAWRLPKGKKLPVNARFWSLTPFYFVGVPFVFADKGIKLETKGEIRFERRKYKLVHASFTSGTGDAPEDFYVVYIDAKTHRVGGVRYIVSYPGFFPKGKHSPEKFMSYDGKQVVNGITFPKTFRTYTWNKKRNRPGRLKTKSTLSDVSFHPELLSSAFDVPKDAEILKGYK